MTLAEIVFNIKNLRAGGIQSDDDNLSDEQLIFIFNYYRAKYIRQHIGKYGFISNGMEQNLYKVKIEDLKETDSIGSGLALTDAYITEEIPSLIALSGGNGVAIKYLGTRNGEVSYEQVPVGRLPLVRYARYTDREGYFCPVGRKIVVLPDGRESMDYIPLIGYFEDPREALQFVLDKENADTDPPGTKKLDMDYDYDYHTTSTAMDAILKMMFETELRISYVLPTDEVNDSADNIVSDAKGK